MLASSSSYALLSSAQALLFAAKLWFTVFGQQPSKPKPPDFPTKIISPPTPCAFLVPVAAFPLVFVLGCLFGVCLGALACFNRGKGRGLTISAVLLPLAVFKRFPVDLAPISLNPWVPAGFVFNPIRRHFAVHGTQYGHTALVGFKSHVFWMLATVAARKVWQCIPPPSLDRHSRRLIGVIPLLLIALTNRNRIVHAMWSYYCVYSRTCFHPVKNLPQRSVGLTYNPPLPSGWTSMDLALNLVPACVHITALFIFLSARSILKLSQVVHHSCGLLRDNSITTITINVSLVSGLWVATFSMQTVLALVHFIHDRNLTVSDALTSAEVRSEIQELLRLVERALPTFRTTQRARFAYYLFELRQAHRIVWRITWGSLSLLQKLIVVMPIIIFHWYYFVIPHKPHYRIWVRRWRRRLAPLFR